jgi:hypothetical protein
MVMTFMVVVVVVFVLTKKMKTTTMMMMMMMMTTTTMMMMMKMTTTIEIACKFCETVSSIIYKTRQNQCPINVRAFIFCRKKFFV